MFSEYFFKSKSLFYSLLVTLPLFIIYEIGIFFLFKADIAFSKNGADVLIEEGFETEIAQDGEIALNKCSTESFDFVLIDVQMPDRPGEEPLPFHGQHGYITGVGIHRDLIYFIDAAVFHII